jgi:hypothetical protein
MCHACCVASKEQVCASCQLLASFVCCSLRTAGRDLMCMHPGYTCWLCTLTLLLARTPLRCEGQKLAAV